MTLTDMQLLAQLRWLLEAPSLITTTPWLDAGQALADAYAQDTDLPERALPLLLALPRQRRLGAHFEQLVSVLIDASERFERVASNTVIHDQKRTIGELDLLVIDHQQQQLQHWELALKFYLGHQQRWLGPDSRDTLTRKRTHLCEQQLPRSTLPQARAQLARQGLRVDAQALLTRGRLFVGPSPTAPPTWVNPVHEQGWWLPSQALPGGKWQCQSREHWPLPLMSDKSTTFIDSPTLFDYVESQSRPVMVTCHTRAQPGFIVPGSWPSE
ncbi:MAG: DUF1853 family protein [Alcanivorax sp.]|nr:DUF1853 family protein [Alcanivorax sp.]